jgi:hypothetical protein
MATKDKLFIKALPLIYPWFDIQGEIWKQGDEFSGLTNSKEKLSYLLVFSESEKCGCPI